MADIFVATTGSDSTGTGSSGNPYASPGKAAGVASPGDRILFKAGTYTITSTTENVSNGLPRFQGAASYGTPPNTIWIGYNTTPGDNPAAGSRPVFKLQNSLTTSEAWIVAGVDYLGTGILSKGFEFSYIDLDCGTGNTNAGCIHGSTNGTYFRFFKASNATTAKGAALVWDAAEEFTDGEIANASSHGMTTDHGPDSTTLIKRMTIHGVGGDGIHGYPNGGLLADPTDCLIYNVTGYGMFLDFAVGAKRCTFYNCAKGIQQVDRGSSYAPTIENCLFDSITGIAISRENNANVSSSALVTHCGFHGNGTNIGTGWTVATQTGNVTGFTGTPFTNAAGGNFTLNTTANQGLLAVGTGTGGANIGWDQTTTSAAPSRLLLLRRRAAMATA